jgi:hypothetical protein
MACVTEAREHEVRQKLLILEDFSGSMESADASGRTRQFKVNAEVGELIATMKMELGDREVDIYHSYFNNTVYPFTGPFAMADYTSETIAKKQPYGGTALYDAIVKTMQFAEQLPGRKKILILTDGKDEDSSEASKEAAIQMLCKEYTASRNIKVYLYGCALQALTESTDLFTDIAFFGSQMQPAVAVPVPSYVSSVNRSCSVGQRSIYRCLPNEGKDEGTDEGTDEDTDEGTDEEREGACCRDQEAVSRLSAEESDREGVFLSQTELNRVGTYAELVRGITDDFIAEN